MKPELDATRNPLFFRHFRFSWNFFNKDVRNAHESWFYVKKKDIIIIIRRLYMKSNQTNYKKKRKWIRSKENTVKPVDCMQFFVWSFFVGVLRPIALKFKCYWMYEIPVCAIPRRKKMCTMHNARFIRCEYTHYTKHTFQMLQCKFNVFFFFSNAPNGNEQKRR